MTTIKVARTGQEIFDYLAERYTCLSDDLRRWEAGEIWCSHNNEGFGDRTRRTLEELRDYARFALGFDDLEDDHNGAPCDLNPFGWPEDY